MRINTHLQNALPTPMTYIMIVKKADISFSGILLTHPTSPTAATSPTSISPNPYSTILKPFQHFQNGLVMWLILDTLHTTRPSWSTSKTRMRASRRPFASSSTTLEMFTNLFMRRLGSIVIILVVIWAAIYSPSPTSSKNCMQFGIPSFFSIVGIQCCQ